MYFFFFKQKTAYEMRISDWSSDVCSSDLIGGIRKGFDAIGGHCVFTSEWNKFAQQTYAANFRDNHPPHGDITTIDTDEIPDHDVLLAGFPCQPFSIAGVSKKHSLGRRSEERRVGNECVRTCRSRGPP